MDPALRRLYTLWWQPGREMAAGWWTALGLPQWQQSYVNQPLLRPSLDRMIAHRLGHAKTAPPMSTLAAALLADDTRCQVLCLALGLWALQCPDYLLMRRYRDALSSLLDARVMNQLQALIPVNATHAAGVEPEDLRATAWRSGVVWLAASCDPALAVCRLLWDPVAAQPGPSIPPELVLEKLQRWL
ncbi:MAG: hypothetical protein JHC61_05290 [Burkholderiaceae bacterium]|nr:hypothetical protein [Burkholderiaceae bacterium]